MKFLATALLALPALSWALPTQDKRQVKVSSVVNIVEGLLDQVVTYTGAINATVTVDALGKDVPVNVTNELQGIVSAVEGAIEATGALDIADDIVMTVETAVGSVLAAVLSEVGSTLKLVDQTISLDPVMTEVTSMTSAFSGLFTALETLGLRDIVPVVGQVGGGVLSVVGIFLPGLPFGV